MARILGLILGVRFRIFWRRFGDSGCFGSIFGALLAVSLSLGLGVGSWCLFSKVDGITSDATWMAFTLSLFTFLVGLFWVVWPVVAAQVDEAYEMERYFRFPVRPLKLYTVALLKGLFEPNVLFFYPILAGALLGLASSLEPDTGTVLVLTASYTLMCVTTGRLLLNLMLNIMTSRRSAEILFAAILVALGLAVYIPTVDASWLFARLGEFGDTAQDINLLANTARALSVTPPGLLARGLAASASGHWQAAVGSASLMLFYAGLAWLGGLWLLLRFYRGGRGLRLLPKKAGGKGKKAVHWERRTGWRLPWLAEQTQAVFEMELRSLVSNPKARMLFAVPFFLLIILKIVGAGQLLMFTWGQAWTAALWSMLGAYVLSMMGGQILSNGFGYYSHAVRWIFWTPAPYNSWLVGRNLAHGIFAAAQFFGLGLVLFLFVPNTSTRLMGLPVGSFFFGLLCLLSVGNLMSVTNPRRFHYTLARRDRPEPISFLWMIATLAFCATVTMVILGMFASSLLLENLSLLLLPALAYPVYWKLLVLSSSRVGTNKEIIIDAITK